MEVQNRSIVRARLELGSVPTAKSVPCDGFTTSYAVAKDDSQGGCLSIEDIYFAPNEELDYETVGRMSQQRLESKLEETEFHVAARCAGLLEVRNIKGDNKVTSRSLVQYLHRTARDYIEEQS